MLYTSYISNIKKIPEDSIKIIITRYLPSYFDIKSYKNCYYAPILAPSANLLKKYKLDENWDEYVPAFIAEINNDKSKEYLSKIVNALRAGRDVYLVCYEKDNTRCHRTLIAGLLNKIGFEFAEYVNS